MLKAVLDKQLIITVNNEAGALAQIGEVVSSAGINMVAINAYAVDNKGFIMFVCEDSAKAKKLLMAKGYEAREEQIILLTVDNIPGALQNVVEKIADAGIDLTMLYGSVDKKAKTSPIVLISEDNAGVMTILNVDK